ncbi:MAG: hypothetical protein KTR20_08425 [Cellvibrionaceae bacterium]|nr:hypothetical protein [Cellvibrionaceae bacterium]
MSQRRLTQYLSTYGEALATAVATQLPRDYVFQHCLIIPLYRETIAFFTRLQNSLLLDRPVIIIVVINQPQTDGDPHTHEQLWQRLSQQGKCLSEGERHRLLGVGQAAVLLLDCFRKGCQLPEKHGVGLARKIGCDLGCHLYLQGQLQTPWLHTSDADTQLPDNYFTALAHNPRCSAQIYRYRHQRDSSALSRATALYEQALEYYVSGLDWAGSPYAFHTLGSCLAININHYAQARGFPKRAGGEDFYLLNKLAKLGEIAAITTCTLTIECRRSTRVPFGTGPAVAKILQLQNPEQEYCYYHPQVFSLLRDLLQKLPAIYTHRHRPSQWLATLTPPLQQALHSLRIEQLHHHLQRQTTSADQCLRHCHQWLDAFKTLKLLHALEAQHPKIPLKEGRRLLHIAINRDYHRQQ